MKSIFLPCIAALFILGTALGQETFGTPKPAPIYNVSVVARSTVAISYRPGSTRIDFRGTVLLPQGKGIATVTSRKGIAEVEANFENLLPPTQYGREYLTYTLWAITPEGRSHNLGEVIPDSSNKAGLRVTTDLQAFGLIVTAEPYAGVAQPGNVVVLENQVRRDTVGAVQTIQAKYALLPRGNYTWQIPQQQAPAHAPKVSMSKYQAQLQIYEAQNAIGIARAADAGHAAPETLAKAEMRLEDAQRLLATKGSTNEAIRNARLAQQTAEDARAIAMRLGEEVKAANDAQAAAKERLALEQSQAEARRAIGEADAARAQAETERTARQRAEANAADAQKRMQPGEATADRSVTPPSPQNGPGTQATGFRLRLLDRLNGIMSTNDTPRGLVVTVGYAAFEGDELRAPVAAQIDRIASLLMSADARLKVDVGGYADSAAGAPDSLKRALAVQRRLVSHGVPAAMVSAQGLGDARPVTSNSTLAGREQNRRVEIVISGEAIGTLPSWERTSSALPSR